MSRIGVINADLYRHPLSACMFGGDDGWPMVVDATNIDTFANNTQRRVHNVGASVGLELELENFHPFGPTPSTWSTHRDGSLRNGREFVTSQGTNGRSFLDVCSDLVGLRHLLERGGCSPSWRAALQMHVAGTHLSARFLSRLMVVYSMLEPYIFGMVGNGRHQSNFCVPWSASSSIVQALYNSLQRAIRSNDVEECRLLIRQWPKYSALNLLPLSSIGTMEFRQAQLPAGPGALSTALDILEVWYSVLVLTQMVSRYELSDLPEVVANKTGEFRGEYGEAPETLALVEDSLALTLSLVNYKPPRSAASEARMRFVQILEEMDEDEDEDEDAVDYVVDQEGI